MPVRFLEHYRKADRIMLALIWLMFLFSLGLAFWHDTLMQAVIVGGGTGVVLTPPSPSSRHPVHSASRGCRR